MAVPSHLARGKVAVSEPATTSTAAFAQFCVLASLALRGPEAAVEALALEEPRAQAKATMGNNTIEGCDPGIDGLRVAHFDTSALDGQERRKREYGTDAPKHPPGSEADASASCGPF